jgi:hypothetical protein
MNRLFFKKGRQQGAVAIMFALTVFVLLGFMALSIDLGRTYVVRTELQNAADAAALAGAMELNQTAAGVTNGVNKAIAIAAQNNFRFSTAVAITIDDISVGNCPDDGCMVAAASITSNTLAVGKTFLKVQIPSGALTTFFARMIPTASGAGIASTNTFGSAVAGRFLAQITPLGVCAIDLIAGGRRPVAGFPDELTEFGFRRGVAYNIPQMNPLGGATGDPLWINPLNAPPSTCLSSSSSASALKPFVCSGTSTVAATVPGFVYANTGGSYGPMEKALNSRFDDFTGGNACDPVTAPPDVNIKSYAAPTGAGAGTAGNPRDWMNPGANTYPSQQAISLDPTTHKPVTAPTTADYGVLWSYSRAVQAVGASPNANAGATFSIANAEWSALYAGNLADPIGPPGRTGYPTATPTTPPFPAGTLPAPYNTLSGNFFSAPNPARPGKRDRRVLHVAILDCSSLVPGPGLSCAALPVVGIGKFFMQRPADLTGGTKKIETEFAGLLDPLPPPEIRLYR